MYLKYKKSGFPKNWKEFDVLSICHTNGNEKICLVQLDEKSSKAYVQFNEKNFKPTAIKPFIWQEKGKKTCRECQHTLPGHYSTCSKHFNNKLFEGTRLQTQNAKAKAKSENTKTSIHDKPMKLPSKRKNPE